MLPESLLFPLGMDYFEITGVKMEEGTAILSLNSKQIGRICPVCGTMASKIHSYYFRTIKELPVFDYKVLLKLRSRKYYCDNLVCNRKVFTERYANYFMTYKRVSDRLERKLLKIALLVGGNSGAKLCRTLNISASSSTIIRQIHRQILPEIVTSEIVGIDDWAFRKGVYYGTAIVDLEQHRVVDLLPDRESSSVEEWLSKRSHIRIVTRDRYSGYAKGIAKGLPGAIQVADRWHLLKNLGDALQKMLERTRQEIRRRNRDVQLQPIVNIMEPVLPIIQIKETNNTHQTKGDTLLQQIKELHKGNIPIRQIARTMKISRNTIRKYLRLDTIPRKSRSKSNICNYIDYIQKRMQEDAGVEIIQLWKEVSKLGFKGCRSQFYVCLKDYVKPKQRKNIPGLKDISWLPSKVSILLYQKENLLPAREKALLQELQSQSPEITTASKLSRKFRELMENKQGDLLKEWVMEAERSGVHEIKSFAKSLLTDYEAVKNALTFSWSNGQVEGQINKLKTVKRQMYGRASFELLRKRMVLGSD